MIPKLNFNIPWDRDDRAIGMRYFFNFEVEICCGDGGVIHLCSNVLRLKVVRSLPIRREKNHLAKDIQVCKIIFFRSMASQIKLIILVRTVNFAIY
jgi:hypothetical protein